MIITKAIYKERFRLMEKQKLWRDEKGDVKPFFGNIEGISFQEHPLEFFILLARYKFAARMLRKHHSVIDVGCGKGMGSVLLSKFANTVVGADFDRDLLSFNEKEFSKVNNLSFKHLDLMNVDKIHCAQYDVVVSMDVIEHFPQKDIPIVVKNYASLIKEGGFAVIGTPSIASRPYASQRRLDTHPFEFNPKEYEEALKSGFSNVFIFSMTDENVSTAFSDLAWYLIAICVK
jgi:2-polyprenyl-3-methyl-5-hydroxy-6-metoxy-1,4-benzoquinol methylase